MRISKTFWISIFFVFQISLAFGQLGDLPDLFQASPSDAEDMMEEYLNPSAKALGNGLNAGWYNTAKPHKFPGFDITVGSALVFVPDEDYEFDLNELDLNSVNVVDKNISPTIAGEKDGVSLENDTYSELTFNTPDGADLATVPVPSLKVGVGVPFLDGTELMGRYIPKLDFDQAKVGLWGIGAKYDVIQHVPIAKRVPALNVSVMAAYTNLSASKDVSYTPEDMGVDEMVSGFDNQSIDLNTESFTANAIASIDIPVVTVFASAGVTSNTSSLELLGNYPVSVSIHDETGNLTVKDEDVEKNPVSLKFEDNADMIPRLNAGVRFKLAVVTLHVDYTYSAYSMVSGGVGISFR